MFGKTAKENITTLWRFVGNFSPNIQWTFWGCDIIDRATSRWRIYYIFFGLQIYFQKSRKFPRQTRLICKLKPQGCFRDTLCTEEF